MGILTKHLLEPPVPPRKRRPDLDIPPDVEAICLKAMEKDRDKRYADMDAFYRALGAAGGVPFEPSQVFVAPRPPKASLKYPTLAAAERRGARVADGDRGAPRARSRTSGPGRRRGVAGGRPQRRSTIAIGAWAASRWPGCVVLALRPSASGASVAGRRRRAAVARPRPRPSWPRRPAPPGCHRPRRRRPPRRAKRGRRGAAVETPAKPSRSSRRRRGSETDEPKADPLHRVIPVPERGDARGAQEPFRTP